MEKDYVFFLGGYDLEMVTIKDILKDKKQRYFDKKLSWGARLSEYKDELSKLSKEQIPVFIELNLDIDYPPNAIIVDHHNEKAGKDKKTSIEQVADLLGVTLNREQELISANDKGYVWAMLDIGATEDETKNIRKLDLEQQGVTDEDKEKAKISVEHFLERISNDFVIIYSLSEKTTPITELVFRYYRHIFIITPSNKLGYSGTEQIIRILEDKYVLLKKENSEIETWSGGYLPDHGYFGSNKALDKKEIVKIMEPFVEKGRIHSQHIFMFPFNINHADIKDCISSIERLKKIHERLSSKESKWDYKPFEILSEPIIYKDQNGNKIKSDLFSPDGIWAYNEYKYFHEYVRDTLFNRNEKGKLFTDPENQPISLYYEREVLPTDEMVIYVRKEIDSKKEIINYTLKVEHLSLRIFETGIGILSITLYNYCLNDIDSILRINDFGRRIYPQFLGEQNEYYPEPIDAVKDSFLPEKIVFKSNKIDVTDTFETKDFISVKQKHFAKYIEELLSPFEIYDNRKDRMLITPIIDDRMFVVCWYENDSVMNRLQKYILNDRNQIRNDMDENTNGKYGYETDKKWYQYIFVDGNGPLVQNLKMKKDLIAQSSYARFVDTGTLYGITRYSFMCLCKEDGFLYAVIRNHMQKVYYQMAVLLLAQRASILKFNKELESISEDADRMTDDNKKSNEKRKNKKNEIKEILKRAERLNKDIILFSNRIWFDEVTPQEQGIELYKLALRNMEIENQYNSLRIKVGQLYDFIRIRLEHQKTDNIEKLTTISIIFAIVVCILTFWAIDFNFLRYWKGIQTITIETNKLFKEEPIPLNILSTILVFLSSSLAIGSGLLLLTRRKSKYILKNKGRLLWLLLIVGLVGWCILLL